jgi:hypothetical protein
MIESINLIIDRFKNDTKIYNLSDGAYFKKTIPLKINACYFENFIFLDKKEILNSIKEKLLDISDKFFTENDKKNIKLEQKIINKLQNLTIKNSDKEFYKLLSSHKNSLSLQIIQKFFDLIKPYNTYISTEESSKLEFSLLKNLIQTLRESYKV